MAVPIEELQSIASILAAGYLRYRRRIRREDPLDNTAPSSPHGHEVNSPREELALETTIRKEIEALRHMTVGQMKKKYAEVFGEETRSHHKHFLFRRIAWRIQALAEGGLSERARRRALEIANDADLRVRAPKTTFQQDFSLSSASAVKGRVTAEADPRVPAPGGSVERRYKGRDIVVKVREGTWSTAATSATMLISPALAT